MQIFTYSQPKKELVFKVTFKCDFQNFCLEFSSTNVNCIFENTEYQLINPIFVILRISP